MKGKIFFTTVLILYVLIAFVLPEDISTAENICYIIPGLILAIKVKYLFSQKEKNVEALK